jgi:hypothetical protein
VVGILSFKKWFDVDVLGFQIVVDILAFFGLETVLGCFLKNWAIFIHIFLSSWL